MNIIQRLTLRNLKLNRRRTLVTIIGVIISAAMITAVATTGLSFQDMMIRREIESSGNWHVQFAGVPQKNLDVIRKDSNTAASFVTKNLGYAELPGGQNRYKPYVYVKAFDQQAFEDYPTELLEGRLPVSGEELLIARHILDNGGVDWKVGDTVTLGIGDRVNDETQTAMGQNYSFHEEEDEHIEVRETKTYTIVGIMARPEYERSYSPGYTVITRLSLPELSPEETVDLSIRMKSVSYDIYAQAEELGVQAGMDPDTIRDHLSFNSGLLRYSGITKSSSFNSTIAAFAFAILLIIVAGSVALIYNAFSISVSERSRQMGMLASVGATKRQLRGSVFFEGFVIGLIGIPLGILFGTLGIGITFYLINPLLEGALQLGVGLRLVVSGASILTAALLSALTILISAWIPAIRASRISPIDAIRQSKDISFNRKTVKTWKVTRVLFGFEAELGLKNLKRNRKRYRSTIFSLVISLVLFLSVSSYVYYFQRALSLSNQGVNYDLYFGTYLAPTDDGKQMAELREKVLGLPGITEKTELLHYTEAAVLDERLANRQVQETYEKEGDGWTFYVYFYSPDDESLRQYAEKVGVSVEKLSDPANPAAILLNTAKIRLLDGFDSVQVVNIRKGETLPYQDRDDEGKPTGEVRQIEIAALTEELPMGVSSPQSADQITLIVSRSVMAQVMEHAEGTSDFDYYFRSGDPDALETSIEKLRQQYPEAQTFLNNEAASRRSDQQLQTFIMVFVVGFIVLITAICIANVFNTITTSVQLRRREFAMLKSVGMTPKSFQKMIRYESLFYGIKALCYGLPLSFLAMVFFYSILRESFGFSFSVPWLNVLAAVVAVFLVVSLIMLYSSSKVRKANIIDALKEENL